MLELDPDHALNTIKSDMDIAVQRWITEAGLGKPEAAAFRIDPGMGFYCWRYHRSAGELGILALEAPIVRKRSAQEVTQLLNVLGVARDIRAMDGKARVWDDGRVTRY